jgi:two-component system LytT family response regulator
LVKAVIIEDEKKSCLALLSLLGRYCTNVLVQAEAIGVQTGIEAIRKYHPDVIFLDIQMPDGSGFRLLEQIGDIDFEIIFTTAFDQYAIKAIKYSALDYLLKPIVPQELINAVEKVEARKIAKNANLNKNIDVLLDNLKSSTKESPKIILSTAEKIHVIKIDDILRCESDNYYTNFFFTDGNKLLISKTLKENESLLKDHNFIRPHKSHLVNAKYIRGYMKHDGGYIVMSDESKIPVSRRKKESMIEIINNL